MGEEFGWLVRSFDGALNVASLAVENIIRPQFATADVNMKPLTFSLSCECQLIEGGCLELQLQVLPCSVYLLRQSVCLLFSLLFSAQTKINTQTKYTHIEQNLRPPPHTPNPLEGNSLSAAIYLCASQLYHLPRRTCQSLERSTVITQQCPAVTHDGSMLRSPKSFMANRHDPIAALRD